MSPLAQASLFLVRSTSEGPLVRFHPHELDETNAWGFAEDLRAVTSEHPGQNLCLDFSNVEFVTRYVWLRLIMLNQDLKEAGRHLWLLHLSPSLRDQFEAVHLTEVLDVHEAEDMEDLAWQDMLD